MQKIPQRKRLFFHTFHRKIKMPKFLLIFATETQPINKISEMKSAAFSKFLQTTFGFDSQKHSIRTEVMAGVTTFLTMAYILAVNPDIMSASGMDKGAIFTVTVLVSAFASILMGLYAKMPFALAPGMGLNAFFAYTICVMMGFSWQFALTAVFIEGIIFIILTVTNLREMLINMMPENIKKSIGFGIGFYISFIGLRNSGVVVDNEATLVSLGDFSSPTVILTVIGLVITSALLIRRVRGALLIGIVATTIIGIPLGVTKFDGLLSAPPSIAPLFCKLEWHSIFTTEMIAIVFSFLFVDLFDTIGTIIGVTSRAGMADKKGNVPNLKKTFMVDAIATTAGAIMGSSTVTTFVESAAGVNAGGRTGLTAFSTGICFLLALIFAPFFLAVPAAATTPILIIVGVMMMSKIHEINFRNFSESIPAFICIACMPLTYSISNGIILGHLSYVAINLCCGRFRKLKPGMYVLAVLFILKFIF